MISTFLVEHASLVPLGFWLAAVVALVLAWVLHRARARRTLLVLTGIAVVAPLVLTMAPDGARGGGVTCAVQFSVPFQGIEPLANIAMLLPLALFAGVATRHPLVVALGVSGLSALIEVVQALAPALGRACDTNDWSMNTVGAVIGAVGAALVLALDRRRSNPIEGGAAT